MDTAEGTRKAILFLVCNETNFLRFKLSSTEDIFSRHLDTCTMDQASAELKGTAIPTEQKFQESSIVISVSGADADLKEDEKDVSEDNFSESEVETSEESSTSSEDEILPKNICSEPTASESSSDAIPSAQPNQSDSITTVTTKKVKKVSFTRLQENDLLLSIYDSISAYRRPSSKPSHTRKIDAIDTTISLLQKLKEQLLSSDNESNPSVASSSYASSSSHAKTTKKKDSPKSSSGSKSDQVQKKPQSKEKNPKKAFDLYYLEERQKITHMPESQMKEQCTTDWKRLPPSLQEPYFSRFSRLYEHIPAPSQKPEDMTASLDPNHQMERTFTSDSLPSVVKFHQSSSSPSTIDSPSNPWRISKNPQLKTLPDSAFDVQKFEALFSFSTSSPFVSLAISQNGHYIALSTFDKAYMYLKEIVTPKKDATPSGGTSPPAVPISALERLKFTCVGVIPVSYRTERLTRTTCLNNDGSFFYSLDMDMYLRKWNVNLGKLEIQVRAHEDIGCALKISNDGNFLATTSCDRHIMIWDAKTLSPILKLGSNGNKKLGPSQDIFSISFSPCSSMVACGSLDGIVRIWQLSDGVLIARFDGPAKGATTIVWENSHQLISTYQDCSIQRWSLKPDIALPNLSNPQKDFIVAMNLDRRQMLWVGGKAKSLMCWQLGALESLEPEAAEARGESRLQPILGVLGHTDTITDIALADISLSEEQPSATTTLLASLDARGTCSLWVY